jgi:hypothetical protein
MTNSQSFMVGKLPPMPPIALPVVNGVKFVQEVHASGLNGGLVSMAFGPATLPTAVVKRHADGTFEFQSSESWQASKQTFEARKLMESQWPNRYDSYVGQYIWLNSIGDTIAPVWEGRANLLGIAQWVTFGLLSMWPTVKPEFHRAVVWLEDGPQLITGRHLPLLLLACLPTDKMVEVVNTFTVLGQGFMRYFYAWAQTHNWESGSSEVKSNASLTALLDKITDPIPIFGTTDVLNQLRASMKG